MRDRLRRTNVWVSMGTLAGSQAPRGSFVQQLPAKRQSGTYTRNGQCGFSQNLVRRTVQFGIHHPAETIVGVIKP